MQHFDHILHNLASNALVFQQLLADVTPEMIHWRPAPGKWNLLEIICHLRDEEAEDFRQRVRQVLENPTVPPPQIDPEGWVTARNYDSESFEFVLQAFDDSRKASLEWLRSLQAPQWDNAWQHPRVGPLTARFLLTNWLAHDYLHIRQIIALKYAYLQQTTGEDLGYAGKW